jgi:mRNA-degrading endonuclease YafQ of YafQ-DinJ toxin-antitoxin module
MIQQYKILYPKSYIKRARIFLKKHPEVARQYEKTLKLLEINPKHPSLRLHQLRGKLQGLHSVSINISYRLTIELIITKHEIILIDIGDHEEVY